MAAKSGTFTVRVVSDTKAAEAGVERFASKVQAAGSKVENAGKKLTVFASVPVAAAMGVATKAASDLEQAVGGTEAVFGEASAAIDEYAKKAAKGMGLSEREFREATTSIGGQLKRMTGDVDLAAEQSVVLAGVAADLAATYGGTTAEAVQALGAAFRGEADPAERFNLNLKIGAINAKAVEMGLASTTSEVDENARAQATLATIVEQSADAQGQFARESDTAAGSMQTARAEMENAAAELGDSLAPILANVAGGVADLAGAFSTLPEPVQNGVLAFAGMLAVAGPVMTAAGRLMTVWGKVGPALDAASIAAYDASGKLGKLGSVAAKGAGLAVLGQGAAFAANALEDLVAPANDLSNLNTELEILARTGREAGDLDLDRISLAIDEIIDPSGFEAAGANVSRGIDLIGEAFTLGTLDIQNSAERMENELRAVDDVLAGMVESGSADLAADLFQQIADRVKENGQNAEAAARAFPGYAAALEVTAARAAEAGDAEGELGDAAGEAKPKVKELGDEVDKTRGIYERTEDAIKGVNDALTAQFDPLFAARDALRSNQEAQWKVMEATDAITEAQRNYNDVEAEFGKKSPEAQYAYQQLEDANRKLADAKYETAEAALDAQTATSELARKMAAGEVDINKAKDSLRLWVEQGLITQDQANQTAGELDNVARQASNLQGRNITIPVDADTSGFLNKVSGLYQNNYGEVSVRVGGGGVIRHTGGPVQPRKAYVTGGKGREELFVPNELGRILSNAKSQQLLGGGGATQNITVNLNGGDHDASSVASHIAWLLGR